MNLEDLQNRYKNNNITKSEYIDAMYKYHSILFDYSTFIRNTNLSSIEIKDNEVIAKFRDSEVKFFCIPGDKRLAPLDTLNFSDYERAELEMQYKLISPTAVVIDIGANLGWYSLHIAKRHLNSKIYAFEPIPRTFQYLNKNVQLNQLKNIKTFLIGLSNKSGKMHLYFDPLLSVNASLKNVSESQNVEMIQCEIETLDNFCENNKIQHVDFIKCDVEGAELFSLQGAENTIRNSKPVVFCEMLRKWSKKFDYHPNDIINFMKELNYKCTVIKDKNLILIKEVNEETFDTNFIFLHTQNHINLLNDFKINDSE